MRPFAWMLLLFVGLLSGCDRPDNVVSKMPGPALADTNHYPAAPPDTTPRDTILVKASKRFPAVDSLSLAFAARTTPAAPGALARYRSATAKDTLLRCPLDTGRLWTLKVQGFRKGRLWWSVDSIPVFPDSVKRIVLDSFARRLRIADTSTPVVVSPVDTNLYLAATGVAGDAYPSAGQERGLFFRYGDGQLSLKLVSDGDVGGKTYNRVFNAKVSLRFSSGGTIGTVRLDDPVYNGTVDNDSVSVMRIVTRPGGAVDSVAANLFARSKLKTLSLPAAKCTVDVEIKLRSGVIPGDKLPWTMPPIADDSAKAFIFLGQGRTHPTKTHFRIVIP